MTPKNLIRIGRSLYGDRWKRPLSRDMKVDHRTVERWANGVYVIGAERIVDLRKLLEHRARVIAALLDRLPAGKKAG